MLEKILIILGVIIILLIVIILKSKNNKLKVTIGTVLCLIVFAVSAYLIFPIFKNINYGLDLQGGFEVLYKIEPLEGSELSKEMVYNTYKSILKRIDILGVTEPDITIEDSNKIRIALAGIKNKNEAREVISSTAVLSFRDYNDNLLMTSSVLGGEAKVVSDTYGRPAVSLSIKDKDKFFEVTNKVKDMTNNIIVIWLDYDENTDSYFKEKDKCGSMSNSRCLSAARVETAFSNDVVIQGSFTKEEATSLVELINSGALPTKLTEISSHTVEAKYGLASLDKTLLAGIIGITLIIVLLLIIYHFAGFISGLCLTLYTMLSFLIFYLIEGTLTLPAIAAMLLGVGMAVDASVINFERIKDQLKIGVPLQSAVEKGSKESLSSIMDANITTVIVATILFIFGKSSVKGFATMLIINIIVTVLILVFLSKWLIKLFASSGLFDNRPNLFIGLSKKRIIPSKDIRVPFKKCDFIRIGKILLPISLVIISSLLTYSIINHFNFAVDFTGGTKISIDTKENINLENYTILKKEKKTDNTTIIIKEKLNKDEINTLTKTLEEKYKAKTSIYMVSDIVKKELIKNACISVLISFIGIIIYVSIRFKFSYASSGIIALLHDILVTIVFFGVFHLEIDSIFIASLLTIIGYSINNTIVTFDMIRKYRKEKNNIFLYEIINDSIRLTLFRSILTTITTIIPVVCLIIFGSNETLNFNIALLVGFIAGFISSIYISNTLLLFIEEHKTPSKEDINKKKKAKKDVEEINIKGINC